MIISEIVEIFSKWHRVRNLHLFLFLTGMKRIFKGNRNINGPWSLVFLFFLRHKSYMQPHHQQQHQKQRREKNQLKGKQSSPLFFYSYLATGVSVRSSMISLAREQTHTHARKTRKETRRYGVLLPAKVAGVNLKWCMKVISVGKSGRISSEMKMSLNERFVIEKHRWVENTWISGISAFQISIPRNSPSNLYQKLSKST